MTNEIVTVRLAHLNILGNAHGLVLLRRRRQTFIQIIMVHRVVHLFNLSLQIILAQLLNVILVLSRPLFFELLL